MLDLLPFIALGVVQIVFAVWGGALSMKSLPETKNKRSRFIGSVSLGVLGLCLTVFVGVANYHPQQQANRGGGGTNTWTLVQAPALKHCTSSPCTYTVAVSTGHALVLCATIFDGSDYITGVSGGGTWVLPATSGLQNQRPGTESASCAYTLNSSSATSLRITMTLSDAFNVGLMEAGFSGKSATFDNGAAVYNSASTTSPPGVTATLSGTSDFIWQWIAAGFQATAVSTGYTFGSGDRVGNADATRLDQSTMPQPTWTVASASSSIVIGGAFK